MKIHLLTGYIQSIYLIEYPDKLLLLDGCCRSDVALVEAFVVNQLNRPIEQLQMVIVSHMHPDHAGGAHLFKKRFGCQIATGVFERHWYHGVSGFFNHLLDVILTQYVAYRLKRKFQFCWYPRHLQADLQLEDQQLLPGFDDWQVISSPGHTDRDIALFHAETGHLYVADTILKVKGRFIVPFPIHHPNQYRKTLQKYRALDVRKIMMAHNGIEDFSAELVDKLIKMAPKHPSATSHFLRQYLYRKLEDKKRKKVT